MPTPSRTPNRLIHETSPYLRQHAYNPVDWYPWGPEALAKAQAEDKPILLSVGYSACHWCHVMERESFEDEATARLMNEYFVNIKVDREERPDIDAIYMQAVQALSGQGGWPMTVFLTPDGQPFYGGTYFPPEPRYGLPGFRQVLEAIHEIWSQRRDEALSSARELTQRLAEAAQLEAGRTPLTPELLTSATTAIMRHFDARYGGWGGAPKFPAPQTIELLLRHHLRTGDQQALQQATFTLRQMARGGIYDQLGGGFHRYSVDERWLVPHFEKMLYDNAQLARAYLHAYQLSGDEEFRRIVTETLDYILREMTAPEGGFYAAQDADSEGREGAFYVWRADEIRQALGGDALLWSQIYGVSATGNWEGVNILHRQRPLEEIARVTGQSVARLQEIAERGRRTLFARREQRPRPGRDEKILAGWNGLALAALAEAGRVLGRDDYLAAAARNAAFVLSAMRQAGRLMHSFKDGQARVPGFLGDYALYAAGLLELYRATFELRWLHAARELVEHLLDHFWDERAGGFFQTSDEHETLIARLKEVQDEAIPSGNAVAAQVLLRLAALLGEPEYDRRARATLELASDAMRHFPRAFAAMLNALDLALAPPREVAIIGDPAAPETRAMLEALDRTWRPNLLVAAAPPDDAAAQALIPLLQDRPQQAGRPTAYVCRAFVCELPTTSVETMLAQLQRADA
ncbi:thioredoxin domain-containing protein [Kallotenue papyrolyticum]|uniref:thioredoxin domain-containing protein n=1 Tax=Kallotenue papyrolyticum TaxID=1325125 RepID=UPI0004785676|nr:thioredoxin domain-containing protein [Kallotenue papyrolyticum]